MFSFADSYFTSLPNFSTIGQVTAELQRLIDLAVPVSREQFCSPIFSEVSAPNGIKYGLYIGAELHELVLDVRYVAPFRNEGDSKARGSKIEAKVQTIFTSCKY